MARVPDEAIRRKRDLSHGAWDLYEQYCKHRNHETGRCDPSLKFLAQEMQRTYHHVSDMKTELVRAGWIARQGKNGVELLVGFEPPKVRQLEQKPIPKFGKFRTSSSENSEPGPPEVRKNPNPSSENSELAYKEVVEPGIEPVVAAAATAAAGVQQTLREPVTDEYVTEVIASGVYTEAHVRFVYAKLKLHCATARTIPVKKQLLWWLDQELSAPPVQPTLPGVGASIQAMPLGASVAAPLPKEKCDATCPHCFGSGLEVVPGKGARRCPAQAATAGESQATSPQKEATG